MIKGWDLTIYELLGYLVPGVVAFAGLFLFAGLEQPAWLDPSNWVGFGWWITAPMVVAYVLGHVVQATANLVFGRRFEKAALTDVLKDLPDSGFEAVARRLAMPDPAVAGPNLKGSPDRFLAACTEILEQDAKTEARDLFLYREGFYRGTSIALVVLAAGLTTFGLKVASPDADVTPKVGAVLCALAALAFLARYTRFLRHRICACLWGAVVATTKTVTSAPPPAPVSKEVD